MVVVLRGFVNCPYTKVCLAVAERLGCEVEFAELTEEDLRSPEFIKCSPMGVTPILVSTSGTIFGHYAIVKYFHL